MMLQLIKRSAVLYAKTPIYCELFSIPNTGLYIIKINMRKEAVGALASISKRWFFLTGRKMFSK